MLSAMGALKDLWQSERGLVAIALIAATTVLTFMGYITSTQWLEYTKWIFVTYAAAKTVTGAVAIATNGPEETTTPVTDTERAARQARLDRTVEAAEKLFALASPPAPTPPKAS